MILALTAATPLLICITTLVVVVVIVSLLNKDSMF